MQRKHQLLLQIHSLCHHQIQQLRLLSFSDAVVDSHQVLNQVNQTFHRAWLPQAPSKWHASTEALNEIHGLEDYVAALAAHDLQVEQPSYAIAAFDLDHEHPLANFAGLEDWSSFISPGNPVFASTAALPLTWGSLGDASFESIVQNHLAGMSGATAPPTLCLTSRLPGGAKKRPAAAAGAPRRRRSAPGGASSSGPPIGRLLRWGARHLRSLPMSRRTSVVSSPGWIAWHQKRPDRGVPSWALLCIAPS